MPRQPAISPQWISPLLINPLTQAQPAVVVAVAVSEAQAEVVREVPVAAAVDSAEVVVEASVAVAPVVDSAEETSAAAPSRR